MINNSSLSATLALLVITFNSFGQPVASPPAPPPAAPAAGVKEENKPANEFDGSSDYLLDFSNFDWGFGAAKPVEPVTIGTQTWMGKNLDVSTFRNGDPIPEAKTDKEWLDAFDAKRPAWCYYNNDPANGVKYGKLYNWYAVFDSRGLAPEGWSISTLDDWVTLNTTFNGRGGQKAKSKTGWKESTSYNNGTDERDFAALPGGYRLPSPDSFTGIGTTTWWWTRTLSTLMGFEMGNGKRLDYDDSEFREVTPEKEGLYVRCVKK